MQSFILPDHKCIRIHDSRLDHLSSWEDTPSDSVDLTFLAILKLLPILVHGLVCDGWELIQVCAELLNDFAINEQLKVSFLVNISSVWTPSKFLVIGFGSTNLRLRIQGEQFVLIHHGQDISQIAGLQCKLSLREWEFLDFSCDIIGENLRNIIVACASLTPLFQFLWNVVLFELFAVTNKASTDIFVSLKASAESWGSAITPSSIWEFIPFECSMDIT